MQQYRSQINNITTHIRYSQYHFINIQTDTMHTCIRNLVIKQMWNINFEININQRAEHLSIKVIANQHILDICIGFNIVLNNFHCLKKIKLIK